MSTKTFAQLSDQQRDKAVTITLCHLLEDITVGRVRFTDSSLQERIEKAATTAASMGTPWFTHEYVMDTCKDELTAIATGIAAETLYVPTGTAVLELD